jgi:hypothetical protein
MAVSVRLGNVRFRPAGPAARCARKAERHQAEGTDIELHRPSQPAFRHKEPTRLPIVISITWFPANPRMRWELERKGSKNMTFGYAQPFTFKLGEPPAQVKAV